MHTNSITIGIDKLPSDRVTYETGMKTAISVDDRLLDDADRAAKEMGLSRSRLVSVALEAFLRYRRQEQMLEQLNRAYGGEADPADLRTAKKMKAKFRSTIKERW